LNGFNGLKSDKSAKSEEGGDDMTDYANTILTKFHELRRDDVAAGKSPSVNESLARLQSGGQ